MNPRRFALVGGILMLAVGAIAFIPTLSTYPPELPPLELYTSYGLFLGLFAMNIVNKAALVVLGIAGILASRAPTTALPKSISYSRWVAGISGALAILGLIPQTNTLYGYWPLFGANIGAAIVMAVVGTYFGFALTSKAAAENERLKKDDKSHIRAA